MAEEDRQPTRAEHKLDCFLLNALLVLWAMRERPLLAPGRSLASLGSHHGPVVLSVLLAPAAKERITRLAYRTLGAGCTLHVRTHREFATRRWWCR